MRQQKKIFFREIEIFDYYHHYVKNIPSKLKSNSKISNSRILKFFIANNVFLDEKA